MRDCPVISDPRVTSGGDVPDGAGVARRYVAFISYSQRDRRVARRLHGALESYRLPQGLEPPPRRDRRLGRFFRDDDEIGASTSLGAAIEGAIDDSENLIVVCTPHAARSRWVDAEIRRFKRRSDARVFAVIAAGEPHASDPELECLPPALKLRFDADGNPAGPDEPRAPDLRRSGMAKVRAELAAGLLDLPFDQLWQRDRRRRRRLRALIALVALVLSGVVAYALLGQRAAQYETRMQAARQAVAQARISAADGRVDEALTHLAPFLAQAATRPLVEGPLRTLLGWARAPIEDLSDASFQPIRFRDATLLVDPRRGVHDVSGLGLESVRILGFGDDPRLVVIGDQEVVLFDIARQEILARVHNEEVTWLGHAFAAPSGLIVVTGAFLGPTNGTVVPHVLTISRDGATLRLEPIDAHALWDSVVGVSRDCGTLWVATGIGVEPGEPWPVEARTLAAEQLGASEPLASIDAGPGDSAQQTVAVIAALSGSGLAFETRNAFLGEAAENPFAVSACTRPTFDRWFTPGSHSEPGETPIATIDPGLPVEPVERWQEAELPRLPEPTAATYVPECSDARPCPIVGGRTADALSLELPIRGETDHIDLPPPRWQPRATSQERLDADRATYFEKLELNSGHLLGICRAVQGRDVCFQSAARGEDHERLEFLRSPDGRFVYWPFGGLVVDLETLQPMTPERAIPEPPGPHFDFEIDRSGLTLALDGRLVTYLANADGSAWARSDADRASARYGVLAHEPEAGEVNYATKGDSELQSVTSLGERQYLAVRTGGVVARLDAARSSEVWRVTLTGMGGLRDIALDPQRRFLVVIGQNAWRMLRLEDGFAVSGRLRPPPVSSGGAKLSRCRLHDLPGPDGEITATCADAGPGYRWRPRAYEGDVGVRLAQVTCAAGSGSIVERVRACLGGP